MRGQEGRLALTWARVDDKLHSHPKVERAGVEAMGLWLLAASYCVDQLTDGFVSDERAVRLVGDRKQAERLAAALVTAGLWVASDGGYTFHDWHLYQPTAQSVRAERDRKRANVTDYRSRLRPDTSRRVTGPVTGYTPVTGPPADGPVTGHKPDTSRDCNRTQAVPVSGVLPACNHVPDPDPDLREISEEILTKKPQPLSRQETRARGAGPGAAPPSLDNVAIESVTVALSASKKLRHLATPEFAHSLASHCREFGYSGKHSLADVTGAIADADAFIATQQVGGEVVSASRIISIVVGFVRNGPRSRPSHKLKSSVQPTAKDFGDGGFNES